MAALSSDGLAVLAALLEHLGGAKTYLEPWPELDDLPDGGAWLPPTGDLRNLN